MRESGYSGSFKYTHDFTFGAYSQNVQAEPGISYKEKIYFMQDEVAVYNWKPAYDFSFTDDYTSSWTARI